MFRFVISSLLFLCSWNVYSQSSLPKNLSNTIDILDERYGEAIAKKVQYSTDLIYVGQNLNRWHEIFKDFNIINENSSEFQKFEVLLPKSKHTLKSLLLIFQHYNKDKTLDTIRFTRTQIERLNEEFNDVLKNGSKLEDQNKAAKERMNDLIQEEKSLVGLVSKKSPFSADVLLKYKNHLTVDNQKKLAEYFEDSTKLKPDQLKGLSFDQKSLNNRIKEILLELNNIQLSIKFRSDLSTQNAFNKTDKGSNSSVNFSLAEEVRNYDTSLDNMKVPRSQIPSQSELIDAVAIFVANRFKEEVSISFVDQLRKNIKADSLLTIFFPRTLQMLNSIAVYSNPSYGTGWKEAFAYDISNLQFNVAAYIGQRSTELFDKDYSNHFKIIVDILGNLRQGANFFEAIEVTMKTTNFTNSEVERPSFQLLNLINYISQNFRTYNSTRYFIDFKDFEQLIGNRDLISTAYIENYILKDLQSILNNSELNKGKPIVQNLVQHFSKIITKYNRLENVLRDLSKATQDKSGLSLYWKAMSDLIAETAEILILVQPDMKSKVGKYVDIVKTSISIQDAIESKNFGLMVNHCAYLLDLIIDKEKPLNNSDFDLIIKRRVEKKNSYFNLGQKYQAFNSTPIRTIELKSNKSIEDLQLDNLLQKDFSDNINTIKALREYSQSLAHEDESELDYLSKGLIKLKLNSYSNATVKVAEENVYTDHYNLIINTVIDTNKVNYTRNLQSLEKVIDSLPAFFKDSVELNQQCKKINQAITITTRFDALKNNLDTSFSAKNYLNTLTSISKFLDFTKSSIDSLKQLQSKISVLKAQENKKSDVINKTLDGVIGQINQSIKLTTNRDESLKKLINTTNSSDYTSELGQVSKLLDLTVTNEKILAYFNLGNNTECTILDVIKNNGDTSKILTTEDIDNYLNGNHITDPRVKGYFAQQLLKIEVKRLLMKIDTSCISHPNSLYNYADNLVRLVELAEEVKKLDKNRLNKQFLYYVKTKLFHLTGADSIYLIANADNILDKTMGTLNFMVDAITVQSSKELSKLIATKAAPVNSYKIKRYSRFSMDLNAYPQFYGGIELLTDQMFSNIDLKSAAPVTGFSCPIGLSFSWGLTRSKLAAKGVIHKHHTYRTDNGKFKTLNGNSFTLTASVIDLGAVVSFRLTAGNDDPLPKEIKINQFIAPGLFLSYSIKNTPFIINFGAQYTPKLRTIKDLNAADDSFISKSALRVNLGIAVDIPMYNIWNRTKRQTMTYSDL